MAAVIGSLRAELSASIAKFRDDMGKAADSVKDVSKEFAKVANDFKRTGSQLQGIGTALTKAITLPLAGVGLAATKMAVDFNASMANIATLIPGNTERIQAMKVGVQELAVEMGKSAGDMSDGLYELVSSIGDSSESLGILAINAKAGAAGLASTKEAINFTTAVTKTYGDVSAAAFQKVSDLGFQAVNFGKTTFPELASAIGGVAPIAKVAGVSMEEMFAVIATATGVTGNTSEVVTQMASALNGLLSPSADMADAFEALGVASGQALIAERGFVGALQAVAEQATSTDKPLIDLLGRKEAFILTASLAGAQAGTFTQRLKDMGVAAGATDSAFKEQTQGINRAGFAWQQLREQLAGVVRSIGDTLEPIFFRLTKTLQGMVPHLESMVKAFSALPEPVQTAAVAFLAISAALGPIVYVAGQLVSSIGILIGAFGKGGVAMRALVGVLGFGHKAFGALTSVIVESTGVAFEWGKSTVVLGSWATRLVGVVQALGGAFVTLLNPITLTVAAFAAVGLAVVVLTGHWDDLKAAASVVWQAIKDIGTILAFVAENVIRGAIGYVGDLIDWFGELASAITGPVVAAFRTLVGWLRDHIPGWLITLIDKFRDLLSWTKQVATEGASALHEYAEGVRGAAAATERGADQARKALGQMVPDDISVGLENITAAAMALDAELRSNAATVKKTAGGFDDLEAGLKAARAEIAKLSSSDVKKLTDAIQSGAFSMEELHEKTNLSERALKLFKDGLDQAKASAKTAAEELDKVVDRMGDLRQATAAAQQAIGQAFGGQSVLGTMAQTMGDVRLSSTQVGSAIGALIPVLRDFRQRTDEANNATVDLGQGLAELKDPSLIDSIKAVFADLGDTISNFITSAFTGGGGFTGAIKGLASKIGSGIGGAIGGIFGPIGAQIGKGIGALAGQLVDGVKKLFTGGPEWQKLGKDIGRDFGAKIPEATLKEWEKESKKFGRQAVELLHLDEIVEAAGGVAAVGFEKVTRSARDLFSMIETGTLTTKQAGAAFDKAFGKLAEEIKPGGLASRGFVELIELNRRFGTEAASVASFVADQVSSNIVGGLQAFTDATKDVEGVVRVTSQAAADALSGSLAVAFSEMQDAGLPILDIVDRLEPIVAQLGQQFEETGFSGGQAFDEFRAMVALAKDEIAGPAVQAVAGLGRTLEGLHNIGRLDQSTFSGLSDQITDTFNGLTAQGKDGAQVLRLMQQPLQTLWELSQEFGLTVSDGTQALLDQAEAAGVVGEKQKPIQEQMLDASNRIAEAVEGIAEAFGVLPRAARDAANGINGALDSIRPPEIRVPVFYDIPELPPSIGNPGGGVTVGDPIGDNTFARGSGGLRDFGLGTIAMLHGREAVVTEDEYKELRGGEGQASTAVERPRVDVHAHLYLPDGRELTSTVIQDVTYDKRGAKQILKRALGL